MGLFETLRLEHAALQDLLDDLIEQTSHQRDDENGPDPVVGEAWSVVIGELRVALQAHDRAEEAVLYELLRSIPNRGELADLKTEEHHVAEELLDQLLAMDPQDARWDLQMELLKSQLEAHIAEEETNVFAVAQGYLDEEVSEKLAGQFEKLREECALAAAGAGSARVRYRSKKRPAGSGLSRGISRA